METLCSVGDLAGTFVMKGSSMCGIQMAKTLKIISCL